MGYIRLTLSLLIVASHLGGIHGSWAATSMICFYAISGYSITARGTGNRFWASRFLRLWPSYAAIAIITQWALWAGWTPEFASLGISHGIRDITQWFLIVLPGLSLVPVGWMLKWVLAGYLLMWLGASKTPQRTGVWLLASLLASTFNLFWVDSYWLHYDSFMCASLATSIGAACYHLGLVAPRDGRWAAFAGALSYPVFLSHYGIGAAVSSSTGWTPGWPLFWASLPPTIAVSIALVLLVERPIARYRKRIR
jgi:peptidoglycan/LPS O-acetylase OafA/YrhL